MTPNAARDVILGVFKTVWDETGFYATYDDKAGQKPASDLPWARATLKHASGGQSSLSGAVGLKRFTDVGTVFVQVFAPGGDGATKCLELAGQVRNAYRDSRNPEVWFKDTRLEEIGADGAFWQINVHATFSYDDVR